MSKRHNNQNQSVVTTYTNEYDTLLAGLQKSVGVVMTTCINPWRVDVPMYVPNDDIKVDFVPRVLYLKIVDALIRAKWCIASCEGTFIFERNPIDNALTANRPINLLFTTGFSMLTAQSIIRKTSDVLSLYYNQATDFDDLPVLVQAYHNLVYVTNPSEYDFDKVHTDCYNTVVKPLQRN